MTSKDHKKHIDLKRPSYGNFSRNEWAITGAPCSVIQDLAGKVINGLRDTYRAAYIDARHDDAQMSALPGHLAEGAITEYIIHSNFHQFTYLKSPGPFEARNLFAFSDLVLVNGNHKEAKAQVLVIDE